MSTEHPDHCKFVPNGKKKTRFDEETGEPYEIEDTEIVRVKYGEPGYDDAPMVVTTVYHPCFFKSLAK